MHGGGNWLLFTRPHTVFAFPPSAAATRWKDKNSEMALHLHAVEWQVSVMYGSPKRSALLSGLLHGAAIVVALSVASVKNPSVILKPVALVGRTSAGTWRQFRVRSGRCGGGTRSDTEASLGRLPRAARRQFTPPVVEYVNLNPQLPMEPTLVMASEIVLPSIDSRASAIPTELPGRPREAADRAAALATAKTAAWGTAGVRLRSGPGGGGITGGGGGFVGSVTEPVLLWKIEPEYTDEARRARVQARWSCTSKWTRAARRKTSP